VSQEQQWVIISLGGSIIVPKEGIAVAFLREFKAMIEELLAHGLRFVIVTGGGRTARNYQEAAHGIGHLNDEDLDWLGIHATRLNAHLIRTIFKESAAPRIVTNPLEDPLPHDAKMIVGAGWKPGFSTDYDAAVIAKRLGAKRIVNLSNISHVYSEDPRTNPKAKKFETMSWKELRAIIGDTWSPGLNVPFDPIAAKLCEQEQMTVAILSGDDLANIKAALEGKKCKGTSIS